MVERIIEEEECSSGAQIMPTTVANGTNVMTGNNSNAAGSAGSGSDSGVGGRGTFSTDTDNSSQSAMTWKLPTKCDPYLVGCFQATTLDMTLAMTTNTFVYISGGGGNLSNSLYVYMSKCLINFD
ncbi:unnamed protein product [Ceratitis capitata]|uniref:(Mediterranean fruit fly) hypothetical protein n=1 Tax=Ceratitis capitata TaxID=7213 RepID=A0A811TWJ4_CERCA|nr:unnamed protein product [Ceratitis capitata]